MHLASDGGCLARFAGFVRLTEGDTTERITTWEGETATLPTGQWQGLEKWTNSKSEVVAISRAISTAWTQQTPMDIGDMSKGTPNKGGKGAKENGKRDNQVQQACPRCGNTDNTSQTALTPTKRAENVEESLIWRVRVDLPEHRSPRQREAVRKAREPRVQAEVKTCWDCGENGHLSSQSPKKKVHEVEDLATASQVGSQDMVGLQLETSSTWVA